MIKHNKQAIIIFSFLLFFLVPAIAIEGSSSSYIINSGVIGGEASDSGSSASYSAETSSPIQSFSSASSTSYSADIGFVFIEETSSTTPTTNTINSNGSSTATDEPTTITYSVWGQSITPGNQYIVVNYKNHDDNTNLVQAGCIAELNFIFEQPQEDIDSERLYKCGDNWCAVLEYTTLGLYPSNYVYRVKDVVSSGSYTVTCSLLGYSTASFTDEFTIKTISIPSTIEKPPIGPTTNKPPRDTNQQITTPTITINQTTGKKGTIFEIALTEGNDSYRKTYFEAIGPTGKKYYYEMTKTEEKNWKGSFTPDESFAIGEYQITVFGVLQETVVELEKITITIEPEPILLIGIIILIIVVIIVIGAIGFWWRKAKKPK